MSLTVKDLEQVQAKFSEAHLDYQLELVDGKIIVMGINICRWGKAEGRGQRAEGISEEGFSLLTFVDIPSFICAYLLSRDAIASQQLVTLI